MKNIILLSLSLLTLNLSAQTFGLKGGIALTSFTGSDVEVIDKNTGVYLGAFLKMGENNIQWSPEIIFHQKGATTKSDTLSLNYTEMGINAHFHINDELALTAGPYAGYAATTINKSIDDSKEYNKIECGVNLGASYAINDLFNVDLRYGIGLTNIKDDGGSMQNTSLQVGFGYVFSY
jgi:hypothetical protein